MISKVLLFPYYLTLKIRNKLYDSGRKATYSFDTPVICIGNVTVGGTGKTPMAEYAVRVYLERYRVAVLSMGYKRRSKGFVVVGVDDTADQVGDEPLQIKRKFPNITVAVDRNRKRGIDNLLSLADRPEVIILDDGFQRREILPRKTVFLVDYNRPIFKDELLPIGRLRDLPDQIRRARAVVITKCPEYTDEWECEKLRKLTRVKPDQELFFSKVKY
ncbi:MAG: tetraacyldisaccharide 4'-kinase, partial [Bacteroidales bacterium]|nr:tetraacyldisaccharide 4'-kinase [Bacteroidales bacterium]